MATPPGNSTPGASTRCTIRHLVDAVCKIRRQKQCATTARIHKAVRQQLQRNVEVEEVLEQLNAATSIGELWRVDNNGVTSYREPPKGTSKEHLKWAGEKHPTKWPTKDQSGNQFMMGHVKYPVNEHLTQPMSEHLTQRANEHVPWAMTDQLRCSAAEPLREHVMEPSRCSMNEAFMWPMAEPMRWPAMNDPMSWSAAEPLRQPAGELTQQRSAETPSWPMNEPFRRPMNESLAWSMNQSLRGPMAEPLAWHVTEPLRHPMADPLAWSVPEQLRRPMTEPLSWHGNDQLRRSIAEPLGWTVNNPEPFRRTAAEHFNWCAPDTVRQSVKEPYAKPVKDTSSTRNLNNISSTSGWPPRETAQAAHTSAKALSRSVMNSQKDSFKETSASTFACPPVSQTMGVGTVTQNKTRSFSPSMRHPNSKYHSNHPQLPVSCKNVQNPCAEVQRTCKELPGMHEDLPRCDVRRLPEGSFLGVAQNPYLVSSQSMGEFSMMTNNQGFCAPPGGQYGCPNNNHIASLVSTEPGSSLGMNRAPLQHTTEIAPEIPAIVPVSDSCQKAGQQLESSCLRKCSGLPGKSNGGSDKASSQSEKCLPSGTDTLRVSESIPGHDVPDEVLKVARSLLEEAEPLVTESSVKVESRTIRIESSNAFQDTQTTETAGLSSSTPSVIENNNFASLKVQNVLSELPPEPCSLNILQEQEPLSNSGGNALEAKMPSFEICVENCASGNLSEPSLGSPAEEKQHSASAQPATDTTGHLSDTRDTVTDNAGPESSGDQTSCSEDAATGQEATIANDHLVTINFPFLVETQNASCKSKQLSEIPKCRRKLQNKVQSLKRKKFNCGSLMFLISVVIRFTKACNAGKDVATTRSIRKLILSKYDVALQDLPLLSGRIRLACKRAVQSGRLRRKGHVFTVASSKFAKLGLFTEDVHSRINKHRSTRHGGSTTKQPICIDSSNGSSSSSSSVDGSSSRTLTSSHQCSLTDMHGLLERNTPQEESPLGPPSVDEMGTASDLVQPPEGSSSPTEDPVSAGCNLTATVSVQRESNQSQARENPERSTDGDENIEISDNPEQQSQYHGDMNPKGLIDGLTRFFTPSNKRNSRVSRNTLQRTLELKVKNGSSSPKSRMLTLVPRGQQQPPRTKSIKTSSFQKAQSSTFFRLDKSRDAQHRRTSAGRRREQLYDGLSHFFAVDSKRRSCTLSRCHGTDLSLENAPFYIRSSMSYLGKKWDMPEKGSELLGSEVKLSRLAGRVIRSRTRSLSLSGLKETKTPAQSKKQLSRHSPESKSLSHLNSCVPNNAPSAGDKRHSHTFGYSTRLSKQSRSGSSESLLCHDRSKLSGPSKTSATVGCTAAGRSTSAKVELLLRDSPVIRNESDVSACEITLFKSSNVPSDARNMSTHPPTSRQLDVVEHCKLPNTESQGTMVSSSSSTAFPTTGKSAMVKLTRLTSNDCSLFLSHGGSCQSEPLSVMENKSLPNLESSGVKIEACVDPVSLSTKEEESTEHPTVLDTADARRIVRPGMTPNDMILFRKAQKIAAERILVSQELNNLDPCQPTPPQIQFGPYELTTFHSSPYPPEFARLPKLFICEFCLKYLKNHCALELHMAKCRQRYPPGNELYRLDNLSVFEVDGSVSPIYCQNICLLARLFLDSKSPMQSNMSPFLFYIATLNDDTGSHLVGYFAKEKYGFNGSYSLVSLLVLPPYRCKGYGDFLIQLSYLICRLNKTHGSPLRPLSSVASLAFNANWSKTIMEFIRTYWTPEQALTIRDISVRTGIHSADVTSTLSSLKLIDGTKQDIGTALSLDAEIVEKCVSQWVLPYINKRLRIDLKLLQGTKSSLQNLLKTSIESEKLSHIVTRKSARKIQQKRSDDDFVSASGSETTESTKKVCERHVPGSHGMCGCCSDFETKSKAAKRKNLPAYPNSPSKSARLSSSDCAASTWLSGKSSSSIEAAETHREKSEPPSSTDLTLKAASSTSLSHPLTSDASVKCHGVAAHLFTKSEAKNPDQKVTPSPQLVMGATLTESTGGREAAANPVSKTEEAELKQVAEKKSTRTVAVQTDAYESDFSDDDDDSSESSSGSSSCSSSSSCCSSTSSEESEVEEIPAEVQVHNTKSEAKKSADALEGAVPKSEKHSENLLSVENEMSIGACSSSDAGCSSSSNGDSSSVAGTMPEGGPSSQPVASCDEVPDDEGANNSQKLESACEVLNRTFVSNGESALEEPEGGEDGSCSRQSLRDADLILCNAKPASAADVSHHHPLPEGATIQNDFAQMKVNTGNLQGQFACCGKNAEVNPRDSYSGAAIAADSFQFGSSLSGGVPNIGMESPMSVNSCSEMSGCNMERAPSQAYSSDCAQVQNVYSMENMGASPACGYGVNQSMTQMTSPAGSSQITSPVSNQSFNIASCSPAAGNGSGYGSAVESANGVQLPGATASHMTGSGSTFKMPVEDTRYVAASSSYSTNGYGTAMASPASVGQCGYMGQYAEQSPGGQCAVINQNSPNGLGGYTMPTPSPTNSSSRSFNMASPNTNAYHGQPTVPQAYDRSCPSAPVLSYARVLQQQLPGAADAVPWTHFYPPQATGYSLIKFPEQELVPQHAVALPRNLIPAAQPTVAVQQHLTQVNLVPLATKPAKCPGPAAASTQSNKQHRRCGKSCKSSACNSSSLSGVRSQTVAPNVTIQPGTNMITSYNVINMNVDYRAQQPPIAAYPSGPYISNAALINDAQQMQSLNIYQHRAIDFPRQPRPHNNVYTATYGYINGAIAQQSFNIMRQP